MSIRYNKIIYYMSTQIIIVVTWVFMEPSSLASCIKINYALYIKDLYTPSQRKSA